MPIQRILTLTTDFGLSDAYVAAMKGVILNIAPDVRIVDVSHLVPPQNTGIGGHLLRSVFPHFPPDTIHVAVVDPGVGTSRRAIAVDAKHGIFVGPDNGVLSAALATQGCLDAHSGKLIESRGVNLNNDRYQRSPVSRTFHGRDVFGPAAAHLALGVPLRDLGTAILSVAITGTELPEICSGTIRGTFIHVDRFGNAISNIAAKLVPVSPVFAVGGHVITGLASSYQDAAIVAIEGSTGLIEIAVRNGSAADQLGLSAGDPIVVRTEV